MLDEYVIDPEIFVSISYSKPEYIDMCLQHLKEPLLNEALVRDLCDGGWAKFCVQNLSAPHLLCKEIIKKLVRDNRLRRFPTKGPSVPLSADEWCNEGVATAAVEPLTGIIASHRIKLGFAQPNVASIEKITGAPWWAARSPSKTIDRKTIEYERILQRVLLQANSLMFIDPYLDPSESNYGDFHRLLLPLASRQVKPTIEIHCKCYKGNGPNRTFPNESEWRVRFAALGSHLVGHGLNAEIFVWDDFHDRYLIADVIGMSVGAGFDVTNQPNDFTTWSRLGRTDKDNIQRRFDPAVRPQSLRYRFQI